MPAAARSHTSVIFGVLFFLNFACIPAFAQIRFDLPEQPLAQALTTVGSLANLNVYFDPPTVQGLWAPALKAELDVDQAMIRLLAGTPLRAVHVSANTIRVVNTRQADFLSGPATGSTHSTPNLRLTSADRDPSDESDQIVDGSVSGRESKHQPSASASSMEQEGTESKKGEPVTLEQIVVTGSRLNNAPAEGAQPVSVYRREQLERSGQTSITDFLNTLPSVSVAQGSFANNTINGGGTVQLHGLPLGTTLVLINGRSVGTSSGQSAFGVNVFDLNAIPVAAIERIEVIPTGSSAIYGSDAIAGVVNILMRSNFDAVELSAKYGGAVGTDYSNAQFAWGKQWDRGSFSVIANYDHQTELLGSERRLTSTNDFAAYGGPDNRVTAIANPGNVFSLNGTTPLPGLGGATYAAVPPGFSGPPSVAEFADTAGTLNKASLSPYATLLPYFRRQGLFLNGGYELTDRIHLFSEVLYSGAQQIGGEIPPYLVGLPSFQQYSVSAANPFNPFGVAVGINRFLTEYGREQIDTPDDFVRALVGARGKFGGWEWEFATWDVDDHARLRITNQIDPVAVQAALDSSNPATALNPFAAGPIGSPSLLSSLLGPDDFVRARTRKVAENAYVRGAPLQLPAGPLSVVFGAEHDFDKLDSDEVNYAGAVNSRSVYRRSSYAVFSEARIPVLGSPSSRDSVLALTAAARYDHDQYFGGETTPQYGIEIRPLSDVLIRGTYGRAFKAPSLLSLFQPDTPGVYYGSDPRNGGSPVVVSNLLGGNSNLKPETGHSITAGLSYAPQALPGLGLSATLWEITEENSIQSIDAQTIIDNENSFPGRVIRNSAGIITEVDSTLVNFGTISVRGIDYQVSWKHPLFAGVIEASISATQTYHYQASLLPGLAPENRVSQASTDLNWAPRWKAVAHTSWMQGPFSASIDGRYTGIYRDYLPMPDGVYQSLGNFWIFDVNAKLHIKTPGWVSTLAPEGADVEIGAINAFNQLPQYSNNPYVGYDGRQADIRGRFLYGKIGFRW
jgi:iron complex outermembrane receptor protein